ncbi:MULTISPECIES: hypothetical protein [unclassified Streptomyces]|uniref:hypothetical protein n=1 Tax=unclassified Streptomyces TaxID=2593676 RepID=UPI0008238C71|nr:MULTISPECIES: hypothetical protein [unclassified Streptomyces]MYU01655.1 hypothetical protein [Streptomyces sp. SID8350]SCK27142.1 hypothetical protein YUWDRAFT_02019 [Streptomyces sp. AmelKG-D3]
MDPYDSQTSQSREPWPAPGGTPIYDRLLAEWRAAAHSPPVAEPHREPAPRRSGGFVPAARTPDETPGG